MKKSIFIGGILLTTSLYSQLQIGDEICGNPNEQIGKSVAISEDGNIIAVSSTEGFGVVRVYEWSGISWTQLGTDISGEAASDNFGKSIALSSDGSILAVGAPDNDGNGGSSGHARVYLWDGFVWTQLGNDIDGENISDFFGYSVTLSEDGSTLAVGAIYAKNSLSAVVGHVRVFFWDGINWAQLGSDMMVPTIQVKQVGL